jgi:deazaflavin-dependent oxidoreductase (nitroreductase family)
LRALALLTALLAGAAAAGEAPLAEVNAALARIQDRSTIEITTVGRKTGKEHTKPIWFVVSNGRIIVQAGQDGTTDWFRNLRKTPTARLRQGEHVFRARATAVTEPARVEDVHRLFLAKYASARVLSWFGSSIGRGRPVELTPIEVSVLP